MRAVPLAAADTNTVAYQSGQFFGYLVIAAVIAVIVWQVTKRIRATRTTVRQDQEQYQQHQATLAAPLPARIVRPDGRVEDLHTTRAQLPNALKLLENESNTVVEIPDPGKGALRVAIDAGTATVNWDSIKGTYRHVPVQANPADRYRVSIDHAIAVAYSWANGGTPPGSWELQEHRPSTAT